MLEDGDFIGPKPCGNYQFDLVSEDEFFFPVLTDGRGIRYRIPKTVISRSNSDVIIWVDGDRSTLDLQVRGIAVDNQVVRYQTPESWR